jgi:hypothetical protein
VFRSLWITLRGSSEGEPHVRLYVIALDALTILVQDAKVILGFDVAANGGKEEPLSRRLVILRST